MPTYYDDDGNPIQKPGKTYYDEDGNPIGQPPSIADTARARLASRGLTPEQVKAGQVPEDPLRTSTAQEFAQTPLGGLAVGAAKGVGNTVYNLGSLTDRVGRGIANAVGADVAPQSQAFEAPNEITQALTPQGTWQGVGYTGEQIGEFFIPGAAAAGKLAPVANAVGKAGVVGRMGKEAATAAGVAAAQGGDPVAAGVVGGAVPGASALAGKAAPTIMNTKIGAAPKRFRHGADPGQGIVDEGLVAGSMAGMLSKVQAAKEEVGQQIGSMLGLSKKATTHRIDIMPYIDARIDKAKEALATLGDSAGAARLDALRQGIYDDFAKMGSSPSATTAQELWQVKKRLDMGINHKAAENIEVGVKQIARTIRRDIAKVIADTVPEIAPLNKRFGSLAEATDSIFDKINASHRLTLDMLRNPINWALGGSLYYHRDDPVKAASLLGLKAGATSMPIASGAAQVMRGIGSRTAQTGGARMAAGATSLATQPDEEEVNRIIEAYGQR